MQLYIFLFKIFLTVIFAGSVLSKQITIDYSPKAAVQKSPEQNVVNKTAVTLQASVGFGLPVRLKIPTINVDASIDYVGITPDGSMGVPTSPKDVGWYKLGARPGDNGSAVIAGHYGIWEKGRETVFNNLHKLHAGDKLFVEDDKGVSVPFIVREIQDLGRDANANAVFNSNDGKSHLNLITCEGYWDTIPQSYSGRLVVFADKE